MRLKCFLLAGSVLLAGACYKTEDPAAPIVSFSVTPVPATVDVRVDSLAPTPLSAVVKDKNGRRNRYEVQVDKPLPEALLRQRTVGQLVDLLAHTELGTRDHP